MACNCNNKIHCVETITVIELVKKLGVPEGEKRTHNIQSD